MEKLLASIKSLDFVSSEVTLNFRGRTKFQTYIGASLTIIITILTIITLIYFSISVFRFENPKISISKVYNQNSTFLNFSKFSPIILGFADSKGFPLLNQEQYFNVRAFSTYFQIINKLPAFQFKTINIKKCSESVIMNEFGSYKHLYTNKITNFYLESASCIPPIDNPDFYIKGPFQNNNSALITISLEFCDNSTSPVPCKTQEEIKSVVETYFIIPYMIDYYFDHSKTDPGNILTLSRAIPFATEFLKILYINYKPVSYNSDYSLITSKLVSYDYFQISSIRTDISNKGTSFAGKTTFLELNISFDSDIQEIYLRSYQTISQLLGEISGIFNFLYISALIINYYFDKKLKNLEIFYCFYHKSIEGKNNKSDCKFIKVEEKKFNLQLPESSTDSISNPKLILKEKSSIMSKFSQKSKKPYQSENKFHEIIKCHKKEKFSVLFHFQEFIEQLLAEKNQRNIYHDLNPFFSKKENLLKFQIAESFFNQIFDVEFIFSNILDFQILRLKEYILLNK